MYLIGRCNQSKVAEVLLLCVQVASGGFGYEGDDWPPSGSRPKPHPLQQERGHNCVVYCKLAPCSLIQCQGYM
jgi:hypothetical protein